MSAVYAFNHSERHDKKDNIYDILATHIKNPYKTPQSMSHSSHQITFVLCENMLATCATLPLEMLQTAQLAYNRRDKSERSVVFALQTVAASKLPVATRTGIQWQADKTFEQATHNDIIYLPALWRNPRPVLKRNRKLIVWLQQQYRLGATICAVGTGCCFMAEAGLLNRKVATTHWHYFDQFQKDYPQVQLKRQHFITQADNLYCAASVNSLADLTVHFIQKLMNKTTARHVEQHFSHEIRHAYESSAFFDNAHAPHPDEDIVQIQTWIQSNYDRDMVFKNVAQRFGMSTRTMNRRFKHANGNTPVQYLRDIRMRNARELLKTSNISISDIAARVGYQDTAYFSALFRQQLGRTPSAYRAMVRAKLFHV